MPEALDRPASPTRAPIRTLGPGYARVIERHLLALGERDRYLRFGFPASDEHVSNYVARLNFARDEVFGVFNRRLELIAMAHLAYIVAPGGVQKVEFGVSVNESARGRGFGAQLFQRAVTHARNQGVSELYIHALSENAAMIKIARNAGATVVRDGSESEAWLKLPAADFESQVTELLQEKLAMTDYGLKVQARRVRGFLGTLGEIREGVRAAREHTSP
jgi:RimJ/RimL family protein N-acetyltransferase